MTPTVVMRRLGERGGRPPIAFAQVASEQLQRHAVTDPGWDRIVAAAFAADARVRDVEVAPLTVRVRVTQGVLAERPSSPPVPPQP